MKLRITKDLRAVCKDIAKESKSLEAWSEVESDDAFQVGPLVGGFDATEEEFCFETLVGGVEYWFQFSLADALRIANGDDVDIQMRKAE